jgi:hypothetical protein
LTHRSGGWTVCAMGPRNLTGECAPASKN